MPGADFPWILLSRMGSGIRCGWKIFCATLGIFNEISGSQRAAAFAYYAFFSIFPFFALLLWLGSWFVEPEQVVAALQEFFPLGGPEAKLVWEGVASLQKAHGILSAAFSLVFIWASSRFFLSLVHGVGMAWDKKLMPWWQLGLKNLMMVLTVAGGMVLGILAPFVLQVGRNAVMAAESILESRFPGLEIEPYLHMTDLIRYSMATAVLFYTFAVLFMLAPCRRVYFRQVWFPALLVSVLLQAGQVVFVNYLPSILTYNAIYGALGSVMFLLLWIYVSGVIILGGGCLCAAVGLSAPAKGTITPSTPEH